MRSRRPGLTRPAGAVPEATGGGFDPSSPSILVDPSQRRPLATRPVRRCTSGRGRQMTSPAEDTGSEPSRHPGPAVETGREGPRLWWRVGDRRVEMFPATRGWQARVCDPGWGGAALNLDGLFATEDEAHAWCVRMAAAFAADAEEEARG
jgi:hypothetical protein